MGSLVKVHFRLVHDEAGCPPVSVESVWASEGKRVGEYVLDNVPFFAREATLGDVVQVRDEDGHLWFDNVVRRSGNSLVRVVFFERTAVERVNEWLMSFGCSTEYHKTQNLLAVSVPNTVELRAVQCYIQAEADAGTLDYEEPILRQ